MYWLNDYLCLTKPAISLIYMYKLSHSLLKNENVDEKLVKLRGIIEDSLKEYTKEYVLLSVCNPIITEMFWIYSTNPADFNEAYYEDFYNRLMEGYDYIPFKFWMQFAKLYMTKSGITLDIDTEVFDYIITYCTTDFETLKYTKINALYYTFEQVTKFGLMSLPEKYLSRINSLMEFLEAHEEDINWAEGIANQTDREKAPRFLAF